MFVIRNRKIFLSISAILVAASVIFLAMWGLRLGIDFTGGSLLEIKFSNIRPDKVIVEEALRDYELGAVTIQPVEDKGFLLRLKDIDEETHQNILSSLKESTGDAQLSEERFESVGPVIGQELKRRALWAIAFVLLMIIIFIAYAFRKVSRPVSSWRYGVVAIVALTHDVLIPTGIFAVLGHFFGQEVDLLFVTALLTILGFSVHDTIVVFDRIRENLRKGRGDNFEETIGLSISQTIVRSINTSLAVLLTLAAIYFFGGETIKGFSLVLILGIFFGTYSSIFVASPLLVVWEKLKNR